MVAFVRTLLRDFILQNRIYAGCRLYVYVADSEGKRTATLATLYDDQIGTGTLQNPQTLDNEGKAAQPIYHEQRIVWLVDGLQVGTNESGVIDPALSSADAEAAQTAALLTLGYMETAQQAQISADASASAAAASAAAAQVSQLLLQQSVDDLAAAIGSAIAAAVASAKWDIDRATRIARAARNMI